MEESQEVIDTSGLSYDPGSVPKTTKKTLREGWMKVTVVNPATGVTTNTGSGKAGGMLQQVVEFQPVDADNVPINYKLKNWLFPPITNPQTKVALAEFCWSTSHKYLYAVMSDKIGSYPSRERVTDADERALIRKAVNTKVGEEMARRAKDPTLYVGDTFFAKIVRNDNGYPTATVFAPALPEGETLISSDFLEEISGTDEATN